MQGKIITKFSLQDGREIIFRYPKREDAPLMLDYINTLSKERTFISFQGEQLTLEEEIERLQKILEKIENKRAVQVLVFCGDQLVGISDITMRDRCEKHIGGFGISLAKDFRGLGIGKKLMQTVLDLAVQNIPQLKIMILSVFSDNPIALKLYQELGFKKYGILPGGILHADHIDNHIYMYKRIRE